MCIMNILFVIDRIELKYFEFNDLVTNFWIIKEFLRRGENVWITTIDKLKLISSKPYAGCFHTLLDGENIIYNKEECLKLIEDFRLVMFRPDPPVDMDYISATYIFDFVDREKTFIMNDTKSIRDFNEKLHAVKFAEFMPENIVTASKKDIMQFLSQNEEIILKPLNKCFGSGVFYLKKGDKNSAAIIKTVTNNESMLVMVQKYIPQAVYGDKRVLILGNEVLDYCVQKLPSNDDFKFNEHNDNCVKKAVLSSTEKENFTKIAKELNASGLYMAGLDVIDGKIIEVNVTSPCYFIREINNAFGINLERIIVDYILSKVNASNTLKV